MRIERNRLVSEDSSEVIKQESTPNQGPIIEPKFVIIHFTAGRSAISSINWFKNSNAKASAHLVIARDGTITQLVDFNKMAWHAGKSSWANLQGFNGFSIGIELDNPGRLVKAGHRYLSWFKQEYPEENVVQATHKNETHPSYWYEYTQEQIDACFEVCQTLVQKYDINDILGHDDIAPLRKDDPGPLFPMKNFKSKLFGREDDKVYMYTVNRNNVNIRKGPNTSFESYGELPIGTKVEFNKSQNEWFLVTLQNDNLANIDVTSGWIHSRLLDQVN